MSGTLLRFNSTHSGTYKSSWSQIMSKEQKRAKENFNLGSFFFAPGCRNSVFLTANSVSMQKFLPGTGFSSLDSESGILDSEVRIQIPEFQNANSQRRVALALALATPLSSLRPITLHHENH